MKFVLNGGLIIGTCDGANIEVSNCGSGCNEIIRLHKHLDHP
jgi:glucan phosphorylase